MRTRYIVTKRLFDIVFSISLIIFLIPFWGIVALLIKIDDIKGPIIFKQERLGLNGNPFIIYKFRSMVVGAENQKNDLEFMSVHKGTLFKIKKDPRITKIGNFLRTSSLDEFPQLFNVLRGDMSIIGPRPPLPEEVVLYTENQKKRLSVRPGCTGLWQVSGRSNLDFRQMVELDLEYIDNLGFKIDMKIFLKTFKTILTREGAY